MGEHVDGWIPDLLIGGLDRLTRAMVERHIGRCERCAAEVASLVEAFSAMALSVPPARPRGTALTSILVSIIERGPRCSPEPAPEPRLLAMAARLADFFQVTLERARALVQLVDEPAAWSRGPARGIALVHLEPSARLAGADVGFVRVDPGAGFPHHGHRGGERVLVLEGGFVEDDGTLGRAGQTFALAPGTWHSFVALPGERCVLAVIIRGGLDFGPSTVR